MRILLLVLLLFSLSVSDSIINAAPLAAKSELSQGQAIELIRQLNGRIQFTDNKSASPIKSIFFSSSEINDAHLEYLRQLTSLQELAFYGAKLTGTGLGQLKNFNKMHTLHLVRCPLVDEGLSHINQFPALKHVYIRNAT
ncbi:MAG: hypothetical protein KDA77_17330, partial [Planctomycetaceae bacterium]|nr:hypothetical protein [Planctomycetaceae bacterium]